MHREQKTKSPTLELKYSYQCITVTTAHQIRSKSFNSRIFYIAGGVDNAEEGKCHFSPPPNNNEIQISKDLNIPATG